MKERELSMALPTKYILKISLLAALGVVLNLIEPPLPAPVLGIKIGLANWASVVGLYSFGSFAGFWITFIRTILLNLLIGFDLRGILSLAGGLGSVLIMELLYYVYSKDVGIIAISTIGGITHNLVQWILIYFLLKQPLLLAYLPLLLIGGGFAGFFIGVAANFTIKRLGGVLNAQ